MASPKKSSASQTSGQVTRLVPSAATTTGGGGGGDSLDTRVAKLQSDVEHVQSDVTEIKGDIRKLLGAGILAAVGLMALMATGFGWLGGGG
jgi:hypothetical protein